MKVTSPQIPTKFEPFELCIKVESPEEASQLYCLFTHSTLCELLPKIEYCSLRRIIDERTGENNQYQIWFDLICKYVKGPDSIAPEDKVKANHAKV